MRLCFLSSGFEKEVGLHQHKWRYYFSCLAIQYLLLACYNKVPIRFVIHTSCSSQDSTESPAHTNIHQQLVQFVLLKHFNSYMEDVGVGWGRGFLSMNNGFCCFVQMSSPILTFIVSLSVLIAAPFTVVLWQKLKFYWRMTQSTS